MDKIKFTADCMLAIIQKIFASVDFVINEPQSSYNGKRANEVLNTEFYTFKHRLQPSQSYLESFVKSQNTSYCLVEISSLQRLFSPDIDQLTVDATLTYWLQSEKIKLLEQLIDECNVALVGTRFPIKIGVEERKGTIFFGDVVQTDIQSSSAIGEAAICQINISMILAPDITTYADYTIELASTINENGLPAYNKISVSQLGIALSLTQRAVPFIENVKSTGFINLSNAKVFTLTYFGFNMPIINEIAQDIIGKQDNSLIEEDNNKLYYMRIRRHNLATSYKCVLGDSKIQVDNDTGYEINNLTLVVKGKI